jgi:hypothetical protein
MLRVLAGGLAQLSGLTNDVTDVIGHLVSLTQTITQRPPRQRVGARRLGTGTGGRHKQGAGFGPLVLAQIRT